jgi:predicted CXXCH cytochrome family protein
MKRNKKIRNLLKLFLCVCLLTIAFNRLAGGAEVDCLECHDDLKEKKVVHAALESGCESCHSAIDPTDVPHEKTNSVDKGLSSEPPGLCFECHDEDDFKGKVTHSPVEGGMCTSCHNPHSADQEKLLLSEPPGLCFECHDEDDFKGKVTHSPVEGGMCTSCHNPHKSGQEKLLLSEPPGLCFECHDEDDFKGKVTHSPVEGGMCTSCHFPHKSDNKKLVQEPLPDLCFMCHDTDAFSKENVHPPVAVGECVACHGPHASKYPALLLQKINKVCAKCHSERDLRTGVHIIRGFGTAGHPVKGKKDPKREGRKFSCSSCHEPHSSYWLKLFRYKANSLYDLCMHCHNK